MCFKDSIEEEKNIKKLSLCFKMKMKTELRLFLNIVPYLQRMNGNWETNKYDYSLMSLVLLSFLLIVKKYGAELLK